MFEQMKLRIAVLLVRIANSITYLPNALRIADKKRYYDVWHAVDVRVAAEADYLTDRQCQQILADTAQQMRSEFNEQIEFNAYNGGYLKPERYPMEEQSEAA